MLYLLINQGSGKVQIAESEPTNDVQFSGSLFVHVVGEVSEPGLYELELGDRVSDAIEIAGGFTPEAE